jgi:hypothetical protein
MPIGYNPDRLDTSDVSYTNTKITVTTTAVEAKVGATRNPSRQLMILYNKGNGVVYYGPTGVTASGPNEGLQLAANQEVSIPIGDVAIFLIRANGSSDVIVQELA